MENKLIMKIFATIGEILRNACKITGAVFTGRIGEKQDAQPNPNYYDNQIVDVDYQQMGYNLPTKTILAQINPMDPPYKKFAEIGKSKNLVPVDGAKDVKQRCISLATKMRNVKMATRTISQPFNWLLGMMNNFSKMCETLQQKYPDVITAETQSQFEQHVRDMKVRLGQFDRIIGKKLFVALDTGAIQSDPIEINEFLSFLLSTAKEEQYLEWVDEALNTIKPTIHLLANYSETSEEYGAMIANFLNQAMKPQNY